MSNVVQNLINSVLGDGARPTKYKVFLNYGDGSALQELDVLCKASSFPGRDLEPIMLKYKGRNVPIPSQHRYTHAWELTFYLEEDHKSRIMFMKWMESMNEVSYNREGDAGLNIKHDKITQMVVVQLDFEGAKEVVAYNLFNVFPTSISAINLGSETVGTIGEYTVTFTYSDFITSTVSAGWTADDIANKLLNTVQDLANDTIQSAKNYLSSSSFSTELNASSKSLIGDIDTNFNSASSSVSRFMVGDTVK